MVADDVDRGHGRVRAHVRVHVRVPGRVPGRVHVRVGVHVRVLVHNRDGHRPRRVRLFSIIKIIKKHASERQKIPQTLLPRS